MKIIMNEEGIKNTRSALRWLEEYLPNLIPSGVDLYSDIGIIHHWEDWIDKNPTLDMPYPYIIQMIALWMATGWSTGDYGEIFRWYSSHKEFIKKKVTTHTIEVIENILSQIEDKLG